MITVTKMKNKKFKKPWWEYFKNMGGNIPDGNFLGGNFPGGIQQREFDWWEFSGWEFS